MSYEIKPSVLSVLQSFNFLFFLHVFIPLYHNLMICNVLPLIFVLEFFVYLFINSVNQCESVSNFWLRPKAAPGPLRL
jgi:hypothetical protein